MVDFSFLSRVWTWFRSIYDLGDSIILINLGNGGVTLNNFLLVLAIMSIVLTSLLNFVRVHGSDVAETGLTVASPRRRFIYKTEVQMDRSLEDAKFNRRQAFIKKWGSKKVWR